MRLGNIPKSLTLALQAAFDLRFAIETGTYRAESTVWLADHFERVWTIEALHHLYQYCANRYAEAYPNIVFIHGDSRDKLAGALQQTDGPVLLWLDAHYVPRDDCPLCDELKIVEAHIERTGHRHFILIDDAPFITEDGIPGWPMMAEVEALLPKDYTVVVHNRTIVAVPPQAKAVVAAWEET